MARALGMDVFVGSTVTFISTPGSENWGVVLYQESAGYYGTKDDPRMKHCEYGAIAKLLEES